MLGHQPLILHYHSVGDVPRSLDPHNLVIDPDQLDAQLTTIIELGYRIVPARELISSLSARRAERLCALTFDDGTLDNLTILPEILRRFDASATVYVCPGLLGLPHHAIPPEARVRLMTADELRDLAADERFELGSHTLAHTDLADATHEYALSEMSTSKAVLEELIGKPVQAFAYPYCTYSLACPEAARLAGYSSAVTCGRRGGWEPFELRRVSPNRLDSRLSFWLRTHYLYDGLWASPPGRAARWPLRQWRHGS
jgi:peptidoglycan/xylan/chitin deacetylase (PgdA/CDA1 family)